MAEIVEALEAAVGNPASLLDVGCGGNSPIGRFRVKPTRSVGVDLFPQWIEESRLKGMHDSYELLPATRILERFGPGSFDVVLCCDLLEHLNRVDGEDLLLQAARVARERVVVLTPNGFVAQEATFGNPWQVHRSGWSAQTMRSLGFDVHGLNGLRWLRGERGLIRFRPRRLWGMMSRVSEPLVWRAPRLAFHILCVKRVWLDDVPTHVVNG
jgi:hypothetical protein